jgi:hypothetical protein
MPAVETSHQFFCPQHIILLAVAMAALYFRTYAH